MVLAVVCATITPAPTPLMQLTAEEAINILELEGWQHLETRDGTKNTDNYLMRPPNSNEANGCVLAPQSTCLHTV